jgi:hypothetical protein
VICQGVRVKTGKRKGKMTVPESKIELVRKLLAKAESTDSAPEREALNERASELIAVYGIEEAMLSDAVKDQVTDTSFELPSPYALDWRGLMWAITSPLRVRAISTRRWRNGHAVHSMRLFGYKNDIAYAEILFTSLRNQALAGMSDVIGSSGGSTTSDRKTYIMGFSAAVKTRLRAKERAAELAQEAQERAAKDAALLEGNFSAGSPGVALVLANRNDKVDEAVSAVYPEVRTAAARLLSGRGFSSGYRDGKRASLGASKSVAGSARAIS